MSEPSAVCRRDTVVFTVTFNFFVLAEAFPPREAALHLTACLLFFPTPSPPDFRGISIELSTLKDRISCSMIGLLSCTELNFHCSDSIRLQQKPYYNRIFKSFSKSTPDYKTFNELLNPEKPSSWASDIC